MRRISRHDKWKAHWLSWAGAGLLFICVVSAVLPHMIKNSGLTEYAAGFSITTGVVGAVAGILAVVAARAGVPSEGPGMEPFEGAPGSTGVGYSPLVPPVISLTVTVGREHLTRQLVKAIRKRRSARVHVLTGVGGVGKASIAALVAMRIRKAGHQVWWVAASSPEVLENDMLSVARSLGATDGEIFRVRSGELNGPEIVWSYLEGSNQPWLIVMVNADNPSHLGDLTGGAIDGRGWLRAPHCGTVIVTSHHMDQSAWGGFSCVHELEHLTPDEGAAMLTQIAPSAGSVSEARLLAERLGGLPLALYLAGWYLACDGTELSTFDHYRGALDHRFREVMEQSSLIVGARGDRDTIMTIWELELDYLAEQGMTAARKLLRLLSCYAKATPIPMRLLNEETLSASGLFTDEQPGAIEYAKTGLMRVGLVRPWKPPMDRTDNSPILAVVVDRLVAETNQAHLAADPMHERTIHRAAAHILAAVTERMSATEREHWPAWQVLSPHVMAALPWVGENDQITDDVLSAAYRTIWGLRWGALYPSAENLARTTLQRDASAREMHHPWILEIRRELATVLRARGRHEESLVEFRAALRACDRFWGPDDMQTLRTRHGLARVIRNLGRYSEAEEETRAVLNARVRVHGAQHEYTLSTKHELARVLVDLGRYGDAEHEYRIVLVARTDLLGGEALWTLSTRHGLARVLRELGRYSEAEGEIVAVLAARTRILGAEHPHTLASRNELARVLLETRRFGEAEQEYQKIIRAPDGHRRASKLRLLAAQHGLARLFHDTSRYEDAENEFATVLEARTRLLGPEHPHTLSTRHFLATVWEDQGRHSEAAHELDSVLAARTRILGAEHPRTLTTRHLRATIWLHQGRRAEAIRQFQVVLDARTGILGLGHPDTQKTQAALSALVSGGGD